VAFLKSEKPDDVGASNRLRELRTLGQRRTLATTIPPSFQSRRSPDTFVSLGDVSAAAMDAVVIAIAKWPAHADLFARKKDVDKTEACLIGWAGLQREASR
jgi:hypothetical protein